MEKSILDKYFVSILYEYEVEIKKIEPGTSVEGMIVVSAEDSDLNINLPNT